MYVSLFNISNVCVPIQYIKYCGPIFLSAQLATHVTPKRMTPWCLNDAVGVRLYIIVPKSVKWQTGLVIKTRAIFLKKHKAVRQAWKMLQVISLNIRMIFNKLLECFSMKHFSILKIFFEFQHCITGLLLYFIIIFHIYIWYI